MSEVRFSNTKISTIVTDCFSENDIDIKFIHSANQIVIEYADYTILITDSYPGCFTVNGKGEVFDSPSKLKYLIAKHIDDTYR